MSVMAKLCCAILLFVQVGHPAQNDGRMMVSSPVATFDKATGIATYTMNVRADSALSNVGVKIDVGRGGHVQSATFNEQSMEKTYTQGSEIVFNYRHGQNRNLNGTIVVKVKYDNNVPTATANTVQGAGQLSPYWKKYSRECFYSSIGKCSNRL